MKETDIRILRERYEKMLDEGTRCYFEPDELELIADLYEQEMSYRKALQVISHGLDLYPNNEQLLIHKSRCLLSLGRVEDAATTLAHTTERSIEYYFILSEIEILRENKDEVIKAFNSIISASDCVIEDCIDILDICADNDCIDLLEKIIPAIERNFTDASPFLREVAMLYEELEKDEQAIIFYNKVLDINSFSTDDWFSLSKVYARRKEYDKALEACDFALAIDESDENIIAFKGYCYYDNEQFAEAVEQFKIFLRHTSDKAVAYELIAEAYGRMEQHECAVEYLLKAVELNDRSHDLYYQLAVNYFYMGEKDSAIEHLYKAIACDDSDDEAHILLGELLLQKHLYEEAYNHLQRISRNPVTDTVSATAFVDACIHSQQYEEAIPVLEQLIEQEPYDPHYLFDITLCYMEMNEFEKASEWLANTELKANNADMIETLDDETRESWQSIKERIIELRTLLSVYLDNRS